MAVTLSCGGQAVRSMQGRGSDYFLGSLSSNFDYSPLIVLHTFGGSFIDEKKSKETSILCRRFLFCILCSIICSDVH